MKINFEGFHGARSHIRTLTLRAKATMESVNNHIDHSFSSVVGVSETGDIHGRAIMRDPASAKSTLEKFSGQLSWISDALQAEAAGFQAQELANTLGINLVDVGTAMTEESIHIPTQPQPGYGQFGFIPPIVSVGASMSQLAGGLRGTNLGAMSGAISRWAELASSVDDIVEGLGQVARDLEASNDSEATSAGAAKIREVATTGSQFSANARVMEAKTSTLFGNLSLSSFEAMADEMALAMIPDPRIRIPIENAMLAKWQARLQSAVTTSMPFAHGLMDPPTASGANLETGMDDIAGPGKRYDTEGIRWPQQVQEAFLRQGLGPGSFSVVDGQVVALDRVDPKVIEQMQQAIAKRNAAYYTPQTIDEILREIGGNAAGLGTQAASTPGMNLSEGGIPGLSGLGSGGLTPGSTGTSFTGGGVGGAQFAGQATTPSSAGMGAGIAPPMASGVAQSGSASGFSRSTRLGGNGRSTFTPGGVTGSSLGMSGSGSGSNAGVSGLPGAIRMTGLPGTGAGSGSGTGHLADTSGRAGTGTRLGASGGIPGGGGTGGVPGGNAGSSISGGAGGSALGGSALGGPTGAPTAGGGVPGSVPSGQGASNRSGFMPMGAAGGAGGRPTNSDKNKVKAVMSKVERDANKKMLLGEPPAVVPGVIGAWAREG